MNKSAKIYTRLLAETSPEAEADDRVIRFTFSTDQVALDGHRILAGAWKSKDHDGLKDFKRNAIFGWAHDMTRPPIGRVISIDERNGVLSGAVKFAEYDFADEIYRLFRKGFIRGASVSWFPIAYKQARGPDREPGALDFSRVRLLEISAVPVPADPNALAEARGAGLNLSAVSAWAQNAATKGKPAQRQYARSLVSALTAPVRKTSMANEARTIEERRAHAAELRGTFQNFGEYVRAVVEARHDRPDPRLSRAPTGAGETSPTAGGFLVPEAFSDVILTTLYEDRTSILSYLQRFNIPEGSNTLRVPGVDETSRANGYRWGGVLADFVDEGTVEAPEFPRYKSTQFAAEKLIGYVVLTNELMADVENLDTFLRRAIADELRYKLEQYILSSAGTGAGRPLSVLNSPALVTVAKTSAQASGTLTELNLRTMLYALPAPSRRRAIWAASESAMELVENFEAVTRPASGSTNPDDLPRIKGRPVIETDVLPAVGTPGDVLLIDPAWYGFASKPMASALSAHVLFTSDQAVLRVTWRCDGRPLVSAPIAATDGASRSAFVALAAR